MNLDGVAVFKFSETQVPQAMEQNSINDSKSFHCEVINANF